MLIVPANAGEELKKAIETIGFLVELPDGTEFQVGDPENGTYLIYRLDERVVIQYHGMDSQFTALIAESVRNDGFDPLKVSRHGLHFYAHRK